MAEKEMEEGEEERHKDGIGGELQAEVKSGNRLKTVVNYAMLSSVRYLFVTGGMTYGQTEEKWHISECMH